MQSGTNLYPVPNGQFWLTTYKSFIEKTDGVNGACQGFSNVMKNALLCGERKKTDIRNDHIYYGVPYSHPDLKHDPKRRVIVADLEQLVKELKLALPEEKLELPKQPANATSPEVKVPLADERLKAFNAKLKALGIDAVTPIPAPSDSMYFYKGSLIPDRMTRPIPAISPEELIKQIGLAGTIRGAYLSRLKTNSTLTQHEIDTEMKLFDSKYPYLGELINIGVHFCSIAAFQQPKIYPWLSLELLTQDDSNTINKILSPVLLDIATKSQVDAIPEIIRFQDTYSYEQLDCYFKSLENAIHLYIEKNEKKLDSSMTDLPLNLSLTARAHIISVGYNIKTKKWIIMDANASPSYEVAGIDMAKHILGRLTFLDWFIGFYPGFKFVMYYDPNKKDFILKEAEWQENEAKQSEHYDKLKAAHEKLKQNDFIRDLTTTSINLCTEINTNTTYQHDMEALVSEWRESKAFQTIHELNLDKPRFVDEFTKNPQSTTDSSKIAYWKKIRAEVTCLNPSDFESFLAREGKAIDNQIKNATNYFALAEIFRQIPNKLLWLEIAKRNISEIQRIISSPEIYSHFKWHLGDNHSAHEIRKIANLKIHSLCFAATEGLDLDYVKFLVEKLKFPLDEKYTLPEEPNSTALHCAAYYRKLPILKYLSGKMDVDIKNEKGNTPLYLSVMPEGDLEAVKWLVTEAKANMHCANHAGKSPFKLALDSKDRNQTSAEIADFLFWHEVNTRLTQVTPDKLQHFFANEGRDLASAIILLVNNSDTLIKILNSLPENLLIPLVTYFKFSFLAIGEFNSIYQAYIDSPLLNVINNFRKQNKSNLIKCTIAAHKGDLEELKNCIEVLKTDPNLIIKSETYPGSNVLHMAAIGCKLDVIKYLCRKVNPNSQNNNGDTPLFISILQSECPDSLDIIKYLVSEEKVNIHCKNKTGLTSFIKAMEKKDVNQTSKEIFEFLLWHDIKARLAFISPERFEQFFNTDGKSLHDAIQLFINKSDDVYKILNMLPENLVAPFVARFKQKILPIFKAPDQLETLVRTYPNSDFIKALDLTETYLVSCCDAAQNGNLKEVKRYIEVFKLNPNLTIKDKVQPQSNVLHVAAMGGQLDMVKYLCRLVPVDSKNEYKNTPLYLSVLPVGAIHVVKYLVLEEKADMHSENIYGKSPFSKAISLKNQDPVSREIADFLFWQDVKVRLQHQPAEHLNSFLDNSGKALHDAIPLMITDARSLARLLGCLEKSACTSFIKRYANLIKKILCKGNQMPEFLQAFNSRKGHDQEMKSSNLPINKNDIVKMLYEIDYEFLLLTPELIQTSQLDVNALDSTGLNLLQKAVCLGNIEVTLSFIKKIKPNLDSFTALIKLANDNQQHKMVEFLYFYQTKQLLRGKFNTYVSNLQPEEVDDFCFNGVKLLDPKVNLNHSGKHNAFVREMKDFIITSKNQNERQRLKIDSKCYDNLAQFIKQLTNLHIRTFYKAQNANRFFSKENISPEVVSNTKTRFLA